MSDILSSPDPLNASFGNSSVQSYSRRITRSQQPQRFASLPTSSPRKQTFELDVGNRKSPQKILVTVEAEGEGSDKENNVSRRLFQSPAPRSISRRRRETITTTKVPLRGLTDDEGAGEATPRKRGRPRRSGTPTPAARKRAATPIKGTPRRAKKTKEPSTGDVDEALEVAPSSVSIATSRATTPRSVGRPRKTPKGKTAAVPGSSAVKRKATDSTQPPKKRGRPRRQALAPEEIEAIAQQEADAEEVFEQSTIVVQTPTPSVQEEPEVQEPEVQEPEDMPIFNDLQEQNDDDGEDIWMTNMSEPPTPVPRRAPQEDEVDMVPTDVAPDEMDHASVSEVTPSEADAVQDADLFMELDDKSDAASLASEAVSINSRAQDTVANGEDFSMIHIDSSFHANSSMRRENDDEDELSEMGDMTSLVVSRTLASLRQESSIHQSAAHEDQDDMDQVDMDHDDGQDYAETMMDEEQELQMPQDEEHLEDELAGGDMERTPVPSSSNRRQSRFAESSADRPQSAGPLFSQPASPQSWTRSPRRNRTTPLGRQLALRSLQSASAKATSPQHPSPSLMMANKDRVQADSPQREDTSMYEDSFSEIPSAVLEAATPRHYRMGRLHFTEDDENLENNQELADEDQEEDNGHQQEEDIEDVQDNEDDHEEDVHQEDVPEDEVPEEEDLGPSSPLSRKSTMAATVLTSEGSRLPTPDQTPPESEDQPEEEEDISAKSAAASIVASSPPVVADISTSRKSVLESFRRHSRNNSTETPLSAMLSPQVAPPPMAGDVVPLDNLMVPSTASRPALSPIMRAGRALQSVTSDPPSPKYCESLLGSPFRSSTGRRTASPGESPKAAQSSPKQSSPAHVPSVQEQPSSPQKSVGSWSASAFAPFAQIKNLVAQGAQVFSSPRPEPASTMKDPFGPDLQTARSEKSNTSRPLTANSSFSIGARGDNVSFSSSTRAAPPTKEDEMDWETEPSAPKMMPEGASFDSTSSTIATRGSAPGLEVAPEQESHSADSNREGSAEPEEEDEDIWANEASRLSSQKPNRSYQAIVEPPRRSKLPSPWRQNSRRLLYRDELSRTDASKDSPSADASQLEYSLLSMQSATSNNRGSRRGAGPQPVRRPDLSSFFSSPALVPQPAMPFTGMAKAGPPNRKENQRPLTKLMQPVSDAEKEEDAVQPPTAQQGGFMPMRRGLFGSSRLMQSVSETEKEENTIEPPTTQHGEFMPMRRGLFGSSMSFKPVLEEKTADTPVSIPQKGFEPRSQGRRDLFSPIKTQTFQEPETRPQVAFGSRSRASSAAASTAPSTPERPSFAVSQKQNFTPRQGSSVNSLFQPKSATAPATDLAPSTPPSGKQALDDPFSESEEEVDDISIVEDESSFLTPVLKPLPDKQASPSKSCIRSPLKPKTPGRVVEFSSGSLSPLAQAQARAARFDLASWGQTFSATTPAQVPSAIMAAPFLAPVADPFAAPVAAPATFQTSTRPETMIMDTDANKENALASPNKLKQPLLPLSASKPLLPRQVQQLQQQQPSQDAPSPLAQGGSWARKHWIRLDEILQDLRQRGPLAFQLQHPVVATSTEKRRSTLLLGKQVLAQGESMVLEQWHLDIVDAFKAEVGGWEEGVLAKRLFALLVGEERRRLGLVPKRRAPVGFSV